MTKKTAIITGASAGIGQHLATLFAKDGHNVVLVARRKDKLEELAQSLRSAHGVEVTTLAIDLGKSEAPQQIFDALQGKQIDFLVNNAGFGSNGAFSELDMARELEMVQVNVTSLLHLTRLFLPQMVSRKFGRVLNIGSTAGFQPGPFMATYYASKAFVNHFTEALWYELKDTGVTATVSCPGATATEFANVAGNEKSALFKQPGIATAESVAKEAYDAMVSGKKMIIHGAKNKMAYQSLRVAPRSVVLAMAAKLNKQA
jgi:short-subunit dehydrogenase